MLTTQFLVSFMSQELQTWHGHLRVISSYVNARLLLYYGWVMMWCQDNLYDLFLLAINHQLNKMIK